MKMQLTVADPEEERKSLTKSLLSQLEHVDEFLPVGMPNSKVDSPEKPD